VLQGRVHLEAQEFVEPLRGRGQVLEVVVIEGPRLGSVDDLHEDIAQDQIDGIGVPAVRQLLPGKDNGIAAESSFHARFTAIGKSVSKLSRDKCTCILVK
jgi:hypothetical protein